jgi:hypothetical protein
MAAKITVAMANLTKRKLNGPEAVILNFAETKALAQSNTKMME